MYKPNTKELTYDSLYIVIFDIDAAWVLALDFQGTMNHTFCDLQQSPIIIQTLNRRTEKISQSRVIIILLKTKISLYGLFKQITNLNDAGSCAPTT